MKKVYKYPIEITDFQVIEIPVGSKLLSAQMQRDTLCLWALVDPEQKTLCRQGIIIAGTGHPVHEDTYRLAEFLGTVQSHEESLVWHIWTREIR